MRAISTLPENGNRVPDANVLPYWGGISNPPLPERKTNPSLKDTYSMHT